MDYLLMNKEDKLLSFRTETDAIGTRVTETKSYNNKRPHGWNGIERWIETRNYAKHKNHFQSMLKDWQIDTTDGFLQVSHALGLNDTLWVKSETSTLKWADVSLYSNQFNDIAARTAFETVLHGLQLSSTSPEFCFAMDADLETDAALSDYFRRNDVGHKLDGDFIEVARAFMTPKRRERMAKTIDLPRHPLYNLPDRRMERLDAIVRQNYDCIRNNRDPGFGKAQKRPAELADATNTLLDAANDMQDGLDTHTDSHLDGPKT